MTARLTGWIAGLALLFQATAGLGQDVVQYYHLDAVGNVLAVTDQTGAIVEQHDYLPYGEEWCVTQVCGSLTAGQPKRFTGKERDAETGLDYFGARYYGSKIARFTTTDPVYTWRENLVDPQRWNRYAYARNNPLRYVDPDGKQSLPALIPLMTTLDPAALADTRIDTAIGVVEGVLMLFPGLEIQANSAAQAQGQIMGQAATAVGLLGTFARGRVAADEVRAATRGETRFTAAGRRAHLEEPLPPGFERDVRLPSGKKMDAYNAAERQVIEIKPNNPRAIQRGQRQVQGYCKECDQTIGPGHIGQIQTYDPTKYLKDKN